MASARNRDLAKAASAIATDLQGPAGTIALDRVVQRHLRFFQDAQHRGLSWPQIARLLHSVGAGRDSGLPFSHGHLSAVVWRQRDKAKRSTSDDRKMVAAAPRAAPETMLAEVGSVSRSQPAKSNTKKPTIMSASSASRARTPVEDEPPIGSDVTPRSERIEPHDVARVRETMRRATQARKKGGDS